MPTPRTDPALFTQLSRPAWLTHEADVDAYQLPDGRVVVVREVRSRTPPVDGVLHLGYQGRRVDPATGATWTLDDPADDLPPTPVETPVKWATIQSPDPDPAAMQAAAVARYEETVERTVRHEAFLRSWLRVAPDPATAPAVAPIPAAG